MHLFSELPSNFWNRDWCVRLNNVKIKPSTKTWAFEAYLCGCLSWPQIQTKTKPSSLGSCVYCVLFSFLFFICCLYATIFSDFNFGTTSHCLVTRIKYSQNIHCTYIFVAIAVFCFVIVVVVRRVCDGNGVSLQNTLLLFYISTNHDMLHVIEIYTHLSRFYYNVAHFIQHSFFSSFVVVVVVVLLYMDMRGCLC